MARELRRGREVIIDRGDGRRLELSKSTERAGAKVVLTDRAHRGDCAHQQKRQGVRI